MKDALAFENTFGIADLGEHKSGKIRGPDPGLSNNVLEFYVERLLVFVGMVEIRQSAGTPDTHASCYRSSARDPLAHQNGTEI